MRVTVIDDEGSRKFQSSDIAAVDTGLRQLKRMKLAGNNDPELEWEIRLYEWILKHPLADQMAARYFEVRMNDQESPRPKREVVSILGWCVP